MIYDTTNKRLFLDTNSGRTHISLTNDFNDKKVVFWMTENSSANITKAAISSYSSTLTNGADQADGLERRP